MGHVYADIVLTNAANPDLSPVPVRALVDSGALFTCIPESIALQLDLQTIQQREVVLANGQSVSVPYAGPMLIRFANRQCFSSALILGDEVLLGATAMEDLDVVILPLERRLVVNPASPNLPRSRAKGSSLPLVG